MEFRQYSQNYLKYGFGLFFVNQITPMCLQFEKTLSNDAIKMIETSNHLKKIHSDKKNGDLNYFKILRQILRAQPKLNTFSNHMLVLRVKDGEGRYTVLI